MARISITVTGEEKVARRIMRVGDRGYDMRPVLELISDDWDRIADDQFETEGRRGGRRWHGLSDARIKQKAAKNLDPRILHATLVLRRSMTKRGAKGSIRRIGPHDLLRGTSIFYAQYHHEGTARLPIRPIYVFKHSDRAAWHDVMTDFVISGHLRPPTRWGG